MFRTQTTIEGKTKGVGVRFHRPNQDTTVCELKIGGKTVHPKNMKSEYEGIARRFGPDQFDKARGHLISLGKALDAAGVDRKARKDIYAAYGEWARKNNLLTHISLYTVGS